MLAGTDAALARSTQEQLDRSSYVRAFWVLVFGLLAILFNAYRSRLNRELEEERTITEILQRAFRSESVPLPHCEVGSAYLSATSHVAVGGDVFDVYRLSATRALVLIADISGKGVDAAVLTAFIKFMIRAIALAPERSGGDSSGVQRRLFQGGRESVSLRLDVRRRARHRDVAVGVRERRTRLRVRARATTASSSWRSRARSWA